MNFDIILIGSGPTNLMAASILVIENPALKIAIFEKDSEPAVKLKIAGKSHLNISNTLSDDDFINSYKKGNTLIKKVLSKFSRDDFVKFLNQIGIKTFIGSSGKIFPENLFGNYAIEHWLNFLKEKNVNIFTNNEFTNFEILDNLISVSFSNEIHLCKYAVLALGGASYTKNTNWIETLKNKNVSFNEFKASNVGFYTNIKDDFFNKHNGKVIKKVALSIENNFSKKLIGDIFITKYGLEGMPIYTLAEENKVFELDFLPDYSNEKIVNKLTDNKKNISIMRKAFTSLPLSEEVKDLIFFSLKKEDQNNLNVILNLIKNYKAKFLNSRPINEAISSSGGVSLNEIDDNLMFNKFNNIYVGGECLDWDAPTGGFLIQACVSQGATIAKNILEKEKGQQGS